MLEKLQIVQQRFDEVSDLIIQPDIIADQKKYIQLKDFLNDGFNKNTEEKLELFSLIKNGN